MESIGVDILDQYRNISNKFKKRFLRKPNEAEACNAYKTLAQECESLDLPNYAGLSWLAASKCENTLLNPSGESSCLLKSARQFLKAEETDYRLGCPSVSSDNMQAALYCYDLTSTKYGENSPLQVGLNLEIVDFLKRIKHTNNVEEHLRKAIELSGNNIHTKIHCLRLLATNFINLGNFVGSLDTYTEVAKLAENLPNNGNRSDILLECEINRIILLLILKPCPQKLSPDLAKLLEKYTWGDTNDTSMQACRMTEKTFLLLESLVTMCQSVDTSNLVDLESEFWPILNSNGKNLLRILVARYTM